MAELGDREDRKLALDWAMRLQTVAHLSEGGQMHQVISGQHDAATAVANARVFLEFLVGDDDDA